MKVSVQYNRNGKYQLAIISYPKINKDDLRKSTELFLNNENKIVDGESWIKFPFTHVAANSDGEPCEGTIIKVKIFNPKHTQSNDKTIIIYIDQFITAERIDNI